MSVQLTFYTNPMSRGRITRWMLEEAGVQYETQYLEHGGSMKGDEFLAINPMGKVPAIKHGETIVTECAAMCAYVADAFPEKQLAPPLSGRGSYYRWLFYFAGPVEAAVTNRSMQFEAPADKRAMVGYGSYEQVMDTIESALSENEYIAGDKFTAADVYVGAHIGWGLQFGSIDKRPVFEEYYSKVGDRPAHKRANEVDDAAMPESPES